MDTLCGVKSQECGCVIFKMKIAGEAHRGFHFALWRGFSTCSLGSCHPTRDHAWFKEDGIYEDEEQHGPEQAQSHFTATCRVLITANLCLLTTREMK